MNSKQNDTDRLCNQHHEDDDLYLYDVFTRLRAVDEVHAPPFKTIWSTAEGNLRAPQSSPFLCYRYTAFRSAGILAVTICLIAVYSFVLRQNQGEPFGNELISGAEQLLQWESPTTVLLSSYFDDPSVTDGNDGSTTSETNSELSGWEVPSDGLWPSSGNNATTNFEAS